MSHKSLLFCALVLLAGCRVAERESVLRPLPEGQAFTYMELLARARSTASAGLEAFYVDAWVELEDTATSLAQTARCLAKSSEVPIAVKDRIGSETDQLSLDAVKLGEAARAKNAKAVNEALQRINPRIRDLKPEDRSPPPMAPPKVTTPAPPTTQPQPPHN